ncbi:fructose-specific phosphotransferase system IIA component [Algisphaera agarilytica]|uniref:Fructose-specific phosphotransferase system IIA component n=2 Tax=Algisphaera agarilytica TaxID=1385975 RepID=A0A7X0H7W5_9BACT|nr:fructose-specific phosphotransferase system IIA component [Algisphaera agarilytica]
MACLPMLLTDILQPDCVMVPLVADDKQSAIFQLADLLVEKTDIEDAQALKDAIWQRETVRTTGIGGGVAVPHGKTEGVPSLHMAIGRTAQPLEFGAIDRNPVELIILLASPPDQTGPHIEALSRISRMLIDADARDKMKSLETPEEVYAMIKEVESSVA